MPDGGADVPLCDRLRGVLRALPAPIAIVTTVAQDGTPTGLAMSAIMPVSLDPCAMGIAVNRGSSSHAAMLHTRRYCINLLEPALMEHMLPFASSERRSERFGGERWARRDGLAYLLDAPASIFCTVSHVLSHGTHDLLIGDVEDVLVASCTDVLGWANGGLGRLHPLSV